MLIISPPRCYLGIDQSANHMDIHQSAFAIDFRPLRRREASLHYLSRGLARDELVRPTDEMCNLQLAVLEDAVDADVVMVP
jgi:hypothetical protein